MKKRYKIVSPVRFFIFVLIVILSLTVLVYNSYTICSVLQRLKPARQIRIDKSRFIRMIHYGQLQIDIVASQLTLVLL